MNSLWAVVASASIGPYLVTGRRTVGSVDGGMNMPDMNASGKTAMNANRRVALAPGMVKLT